MSSSERFKLSKLELKRARAEDLQRLGRWLGVGRADEIPHRLLVLEVVRAMVALAREPPGTLPGRRRVDESGHPAPLCGNVICASRPTPCRK